MDTDLLTEAERQAVALTAALWNLLAADVVGHGRSRPGDLAELGHHVHAIQQAVLSQAAARAYPDLYRLLGGELAVPLRPAAAAPQRPARRPGVKRRWGR